MRAADEPRSRVFYFDDAAHAIGMRQDFARQSKRLAVARIRFVGVLATRLPGFYFALSLKVASFRDISSRCR